MRRDTRLGIGIGVRVGILTVVGFVGNGLRMTLRCDCGNVIERDRSTVLKNKEFHRSHCGRHNQNDKWMRRHD